MQVEAIGGDGPLIAGERRTEDRQHQGCPLAGEQAQGRFGEGIADTDKLGNDVSLRPLHGPPFDERSCCLPQLGEGRVASWDSRAQRARATRPSRSRVFCSSTRHWAHNVSDSISAKPTESDPADISTSRARPRRRSAFTRGARSKMNLNYLRIGRRHTLNGTPCRDNGASAQR